MKPVRYRWALIPILTAGMLSWIAFAILAARRRSVPLTLAAIVYLTLFAFISSPICQSGDSLNGLGGTVLCVLWGASSFHALWLAGGERSRQAAGRPLTSAPIGPAPVTGLDGGQIPATDMGLRESLLAEIASAAASFGSAPTGRRIDPDIWSGLQDIVNEGWTLLTTARHKHVLGDQLIAVELMYSDYIPSSVHAVTALAPEQLVTAEDAARANRTAREIVDSISRELTSMMRSVGSGDLAKLDEQRAFLQSRFGQTGSIHL